MGFGDRVGHGVDGRPRAENSIVWSGKRRRGCAPGGAFIVAGDGIDGCSRSGSEGGACRSGGHAAGRLINYADKASLKFRVLAPGNVMTVLISSSLWNIPTGTPARSCKNRLGGSKIGACPTKLTGFSTAHYVR